MFKLKTGFITDGKAPRLPLSFILSILRIRSFPLICLVFQREQNLHSEKPSLDYLFVQMVTIFGLKFLFDAVL